MAYSIYIADDEKNIRDLIKSFLENDGYTVRTFETGDALYDTYKEVPCDLVILDIMMPGTDGLTVCSRLREITDVPIIMLTAKDTEYDYVQGITLGSDDYLTKPFRPTVLLMRVRALLRRVEMSSKKNSQDDDFSDVTLGNLSYSAESGLLKCGGREVDLTKTEMRMLVYMMHSPGKAFSREELLDVIWGFQTEVETRVTDETMRRVRKKISAAGSSVSIQTVWGTGYRIVKGDNDR